MNKLTLEKAKDLYVSTGFCEHEFCEDVKPYGCNVQILTCRICAEVLNKDIAEKIEKETPIEKLRKKNK